MSCCYIGMRQGLRLAALVCASLALIASPAWAGGGGFAGFRTPSGNVHCMYDPGDAGPPAVPPNIRCDILKVEGPLPAPPRSCDGEWGRSFVIGQEDNIGQMICAGDAVFSDETPVLAYGSAWQEAGFTCTSEETGLSCFNAKRHGFTLSRSSRKVF